MGFIQSNHSRILYNSTMISFNVSALRDIVPQSAVSCGLPPAVRHPSPPIAVPTTLSLAGRTVAHIPRAHVAVPTTADSHVWPSH